MKIITSENIPKSNGHYSQAIGHNGVLYISGQLPVNPVTKKVPETIEEQTLLTLSKIETILNESGSSKSLVLQVRIYIADIVYWNKVNDVYANFFGDHKPVRCIIPTGELHYGCLVEIEATAVWPQQEK